MNRPNKNIQLIIKMELNDFIKKFAELFDDTDESEIQADTDFTELDEWSSLIVLSVIAMVKTEYDKTVTSKEIRACDDVEALYKLVEGK